MNVQQMQNTAFEDVNTAMMVAMRGKRDGGSYQIIRVYIDGKKAASSVEKAQRNHCASIIIGN